MNFTGWVKGGTVLSVISFYFVVSPCQSQVNVVQLTDRATFLTNHCNPAREPSLSSDVPLYLKQSWGVRVWGAGKKKRRREKPWPRYHHFILIFFIPFFNPSDEVWTGRGMLSQTAISLHHMRLTHGREERGLSAAQPGERREEENSWHEIQNGQQSGALIPRDVSSAAST